MHHGKWCSEPELVRPTASCSVCGFAGERPRVFTIQRSPDVYLLECPQCKIASASRMPAAGTLASYYGTYDSAQDPAKPRITFSSPQRLADHIISLVGPSIPATATRILDFGGGDGTLAVLIAQRLLAAGQTGQKNAEGITIDLIDYSPQRV